MTRRNSRIAMPAKLLPLLVWLACTFCQSQTVSAQNQTILAEMYGRGVHAMYSGQLNDAYNFLSSAINGGSKDPRAYYFRGIVLHKQGRSYEAEADWNQGAMMEARTGGASSVGRSLSRFQGSGRLKLETIRQQARFQSMADSVIRSDIRSRELGVSPGAPAITPPAAPSATRPAPEMPSAPVADNPFADDAGPGAMASGEPKLESDNAMEGLDGNPFADDPAAPGAAAADSPASDPFGSGGASDDPFGTASPSAPSSDADPFGTSPAGDDPFGDPFGN